MPDSFEDIVAGLEDRGLPPEWAYAPPPKQLAVPYKNTIGYGAGSVVVIRRSGLFFDDFVLTDQAPQIVDGQVYLSVVDIHQWALIQAGGIHEPANIWACINDVFVYEDIPGTEEIDFDPEMPVRKTARQGSRIPPVRTPRPARSAGRLTGRLVRTHSDPTTKCLSRDKWFWWIAASERSEADGGYIDVAVMTLEDWADRGGRPGRKTWIPEECVWVY